MGNSSSRFTSDPSSFATPFIPQLSNLVSDDDRSHWRSYDYIIIGGGSAGCVLASRLSEDPNTTVLVIEAGASHEGNLMSRLPLGTQKLLQSPADWNFYTVPQDAFDGRTVHWPRGKILGGTSSINALLYHNSAPEDFDCWERMGATGWNYNSLKKYLNRVREEGPRSNPQTGIAPASTAALAAFERMGVPLRSDFNTDEGTMGAGALLAAVDANHERSSSATAYLTPEVTRRPNLTVAVSTFTERILFSTGADGVPTAVGVQLSTGRTAPKFAVAATREVVLSAGVVGSPHILQLSGVGPAALLQTHKIPVVRDLPHVGRNVLDHVSSGSIVLRARPGQTLDKYAQNPIYGGLALAQWLLLRTGPMACIPAQVASFTRLDDDSLPYGPSPGPVQDLSSGPGAPDLEVLVFPIAAINYGLDVPPRGNYGISVGSILLKPASSGTITIRSNSVYDPPAIDPNYLAEESDLNALVKSTRFILRLARTPPLADALDLRNLATPPADPDFYWPGDADPDKITDDEIKKFIRKAGQSTYHPLCSVRMGADATTSAVDPQLRAHGVRALRVVDGAVFPGHVSGHPCVPIMAVAERAADLMRGRAA